MRAVFVTLLLAATATVPPASQPPQIQPAAPKPRLVDGIAYKDCNCGTAYRTLRAWQLHRPSTPQEQAETAQLNRAYLTSVRAAPLPPPPQPDRAQQDYQVRLKNYRILTESYERRMRDYYRLHPPASLESNAPPSGEARGQDAARLDPWHGYTPHADN